MVNNSVIALIYAEIDLGVLDFNPYKSIFYKEERELDSNVCSIRSETDLRIFGLLFVKPF